MKKRYILSIAATLFAIMTATSAEERDAPEVPLDVKNVLSTYMGENVTVRAVLVQSGWEHIRTDLFLEWISISDNRNEGDKKVHSTHVTEIGGPWVMDFPRWDGKNSPHHRLF